MNAATSPLDRREAIRFFLAVIATLAIPTGRQGAHAALSDDHDHDALLLDVGGLLRLDALDHQAHYPVRLRAWADGRGEVVVSPHGRPERVVPIDGAALRALVDGVRGELPADAIPCPACGREGWRLCSLCGGDGVVSRGHVPAWPRRSVA